MLYDEFKDDTDLVKATIHSGINALEAHHFIHKLDKNQRKESRDYIEILAGKKDNRTNLYVIEQADNTIHLLSRHTDSKIRLPEYVLAPGYVDYDEKFSNAWNDLLQERLIDKTTLDQISRLILQLLERILSLPFSTEMGKIAPSTTEPGVHCINCGINHEARDFLRAVLLKLLDHTEINSDYVKFLREKKILSDTGYARYSEAVSFNSQLTKTHSRKHLRTAENKEGFGIVFRIVAIDNFGFLGLKEDGSYIVGKMSPIGASSELRADTLVEYTNPSMISDDNSEIEVTKNSIRILQEDDREIPKREDIKIASIRNIREEGEYYHIDATIVRKETKESHSVEAPEVFGILRLKDSTGEIDYITSPYHDELKVGDRVDIIGVCHNSSFYANGKKQQERWFCPPSIETLLLI